MPFDFPPPVSPDEAPFETIEGNISSGLLIVCDHASNLVPAEYGDLGLPREQFERHIGYDIGVRDLTCELARRLALPAVMTTYSRLLIDPNRGEDDPTLVMRLSDGAVVPGNALVDEAERTRRMERFHKPYHAEVDRLLDRMLASGNTPAILSIHSYTPVWRGVPRPWHAGILWDSDPRFPLPLLAALRADAELVVGDNEPYDGCLKNDCMYRHGTARGIAHALIEVRQDLIADGAGVKAWADRLAPILEELNEKPELHRLEEHRSRADR
ncbi:N-formylglutamate amidohydrolase [Stappia sp. GBMRC 2046]|uniref:N-formylglutamate amidohydrolase n=1 Tax=Stappia sediminis TaxID=2692190 RepID=A0A7X3LUI6_9HYPH|nr:N-formylglutamate amidohydrolase [Stappia sediminis]MXN65318.1 N-formylglutamate amidohydrolase [Stappia sediminis]